MTDKEFLTELHRIQEQAMRIKDAFFNIRICGGYISASVSNMSSSRDITYDSLNEKLAEVCDVDYVTKEEFIRMAREFLFSLSVSSSVKSKA